MINISLEEGLLPGPQACFVSPAEWGSQLVLQVYFGNRRGARLSGAPKGKSGPGPAQNRYLLVAG